MFSFSGTDGEPFTFYPVFPCSEIHSKTFPLLPCAIAVGGLKQSWLVWPPPIGASSRNIEYGQPEAPPNTLVRRLSNGSHSESGAFSRGAQTATNTQTLLRSLYCASDFWGLSVWMMAMMMGAIRSSRIVVAAAFDRCEGKLALSLPFDAKDPSVFNSCCCSAF